MDQALAKCNNFQEFNLPGLDSTESLDFNDSIKIGVKEDSIAQHLLLISDILDNGSDSKIAKILSSHIWIFGINSTSIPLWTSDNPIVIQAYKDFGTGLSSEGVQVVYPISPKHLLIMLESSVWKKCKSFDGMSAILGEDDVRLYNKLQLQQCERQTYSIKNYFEL